jgi:hypothetical protein
LQHSKRILAILNKSNIFVSYNSTNLQMLAEEFLRCGYSYNDLDFLNKPCFSLLNYWRRSEPYDYQNALIKFEVDGTNKEQIDVYPTLTPKMLNAFADKFDTEFVEEVLQEDIEFKYLDGDRMFKQCTKTNSIFFAKGKHLEKNVFEVLKTDNYMDWVLSNKEFCLTTKAVAEHLKNIFKRNT